MSALVTVVDRDGLRFARRFAGSGEVYFDDHCGWTFSVDRPGVEHLGWPRRMEEFLSGHAVVRVVSAGEVLYEAPVSFSDDDRPLSMRNRLGLPVMVDKWGLLQTPFSARGDDVPGRLADEAHAIAEILQRRCGIDAWMSFGTLLGAVREGGAIGHDSDVDLCYLSEETTPARMQTELWRLARALREEGRQVSLRTGSFLTVRVPLGDGAAVGIDLYTTFFRDGYFYATATLRHRIPLEAVLPLQRIGFEGRMLLAPADPAPLLAASYGPNWRVPDPSFRHRPGPEITDRFEAWFGRLWRQRREWTARNRALVAKQAEPSAFVRDLAEQWPVGARAVEVGAGAGHDAAYLASRGIDTLALDFALPHPKRWHDVAGLGRDYLNLYDARDVLTMAAVIAGDPRPRVLLARRVLESLAPVGRDAFWRFAAAATRTGGTVHVEGRAHSAAAAGHRSHREGTRTWETGPAEALEQVRARGGRVLAAEGVEDAERALLADDRAESTWRLTVSFESAEPRSDVR